MYDPAAPPLVDRPTLDRPRVRGFTFVYVRAQLVQLQDTFVSYFTVDRGAQVELKRWIEELKLS
jgi:hypothetical protein